jgi:hypothetical protein
MKTQFPLFILIIWVSFLFCCSKEEVIVPIDEDPIDVELPADPDPTNPTVPDPDPSDPDPVTPVIVTKRFVEQISINKLQVNVGEKTSVGQIAIEPTVAGKVIVRFDGYCVSSPGDRILLAASNTADWSQNAGSTSVKALNNDINSTSFSHSRIYEVEPGKHTFYAFAHNAVDVGGSGLVSIHGGLTVEFIPNTMALVNHLKIDKTNINVRNFTYVGQIELNSTQTGKVLVNFDGTCISTFGDRIVLAASDTDDWETNDGNVSVAAVSASDNINFFSHSRAYDIKVGINIISAIAHNWTQRQGDGVVSIYGNLVTKVFLDNTGSTFDHIGISKTRINTLSKKTLGEITINPTVPGKAIVRFDGGFDSAEGDKILLAASNSESFGDNDDRLVMLSKSAKTIFSHTRVYEIGAGSHTFYALAQNEKDVDPSVYASLTVEFIPD